MRGGRGGQTFRQTQVTRRHGRWHGRHEHGNTAEVMRRIGGKIADSACDVCEIATDQARGLALLLTGVDFSNKT